MNILEQIIANKKREITLKKRVISAHQLEHSAFFNTESVSISKAIRGSSWGIIAEHKRRSPSKAVINNNLSVEEVVKGYENNGAMGISILTDSLYFGGSLDDLTYTRASVNTPLLRKEFIIDEYQLLEAKAYGADAILLIAAVLTQAETHSLSLLAQSIGLEVVLEVHNLYEIEHYLMPGIDIIGVNNRNLKNFDVSIQNSIELISHIPTDFVTISESGLNNPDDIKKLKRHGFDGFLIGEQFMKTDNPGMALEQFINQLNAQ